MNNYIQQMYDILVYPFIYKYNMFKCLIAWKKIIFILKITLHQRNTDVYYLVKIGFCQIILRKVKIILRFFCGVKDFRKLFNRLYV